MKTYVFLIDGMGFHYLPQSIHDKFHVYPIENIKPTITAPNWISILTGKPPEEHKVINNESVRKKSFVLPVDTIFHSIPNSTLISDWKMLGKYIYCSTNQSRLKQFQFIHTKAIWKFIHTQSHLLNSTLNVINTDKVDSVAHKYGWKSEQTSRVLESVAKNIIKFTENISDHEPCLIIITADHGGLGKEHEHHKYTKLIHQVPFALFSNSINVKKLPKIKSTLDIRNFLIKHY